MTVCSTLDCIYNSRGDSPECKLDEIEVNDRCRCVSFESDNPYIVEQFIERHGYPDPDKSETLEKIKKRIDILKANHLR